jgi:hypothetical protein
MIGNTPSENEILNYWPHSKDQEEKISLLFERNNDWGLLLDELLIILQLLTENHQSVSQGCRYLAKSSSLTEYSYINNLLMELGKAYSQYLLHLNDIQNSVVEVRFTLGKEIKSWENDIRNNMEKLNKQRDLVLKKIRMHLDAAEANKFNSEWDPWVTEFETEKSIQNLMDFENQVQKIIMRTSQHIGKSESFALSKLVESMKLFVGFTNSYVATMSKTLEALDISLKTHKVERDFEAFKINIGFNSVFGIERNFEKIFPWHLERDSQSVMMEGLLYRQGVFRKSVFRPCYAVLTTRGFIHCFNITNYDSNHLDFDWKKEKLTLKYSVFLKRPRTLCSTAKESAGMSDKYSFSIKVPNNSKGISSLLTNPTSEYIFKTCSESNLERWIANIEVHLAKNSPIRRPTELAQYEEFSF